MQSFEQKIYRAKPEFLRRAGADYGRCRQTSTPQTEAGVAVQHPELQIPEIAGDVVIGSFVTIHKPPTVDTKPYIKCGQSDAHGNCGRCGD